MICHLWINIIHLYQEMLNRAKWPWLNLGDAILQSGMTIFRERVEMSLKSSSLIKCIRSCISGKFWKDSGDFTREKAENNESHSPSPSWETVRWLIFVLRTAPFVTAARKVRQERNKNLGVRCWFSYNFPSPSPFLSGHSVISLMQKVPSHRGCFSQPSCVEIGYCGEWSNITLVGL